jgi:hypothetical protein
MGAIRQALSRAQVLLPKWAAHVLEEVRNWEQSKETQKWRCEFFGGEGVQALWWRSASWRAGDSVCGDCHMFRGSANGELERFIFSDEEVRPSNRETTSR